MSPTSFPAQLENFLATDTPKPWWKFVARGQAILHRV